MPLVMNTTYEDKSIQAYGSWFSFKPGQIKNMDEKFANFIGEKRAYLGFMVLPSTLEDDEFKSSVEGQKVIEEIRNQGIANYLTHLRSIYRNNVDSLRQDLKMRNIDTDPRALMSEGELQAVELLAKYSDREQDLQKQRVDKVAELEKKLGLTK